MIGFFVFYLVLCVFINLQFAAAGNNALLGAAVMLIKPSDWREIREHHIRGRRLCHFNDSLTKLETYWRPNNPDYPLYLLSEVPWSKEDQELIQQRWKNLKIQFIDISSQWNNNTISTDKQKLHKVLSHSRYNLDYRKMCQFYFSSFQYIPQLIQFKYLMRLDDDTCFESTVPYDIFQEMEKYNAKYGYAAIAEDLIAVTKKLREFTEDFMTKNKYEYANPELHELSERVYQLRLMLLNFATNWEVINMHAMRNNAKIQEFIKAVIDSKNIFLLRWGDAPLRFKIAEMFWNSKEVLRFNEFSYQHGARSPYPIIPVTYPKNINPVLNYDYASNGTRIIINPTTAPRDSTTNSLLTSTHHKKKRLHANWIEDPGRSV